MENATDGDTLYFARMSGNDSFIPTDTIILKHGAFSFQTPCDSTIIASYYYLDKQNKEIYSNVFFMEGGNVKLEIGLNGKVSGTENNDIYQKMSDSIYVLHEKMSQLYARQELSDTTGINVSDAEAERQLTALDQQANQLVMNYVKKNIDKQVGYFLFRSCYNLFSPQEILELANKVSDHYKHSNALKSIKEEAERSNATSDGQSFIDVTIPSINGGKLKLSDIIKSNKLTLVDCWASWCGPCRSEMPNVVNLYKKYHDKGIEIVGISFDEDEKAWKDAVKKMNMTWPQGSELQSWDNVMTQKYGITSIPYTILIDSNGTIVGQQLRGEELENTVKLYLE
ncbi:MAG: AhpC/TSA family protein [Paraprevotella sp.]|nr:AhpC/TSA family protein [Paraprevotella sp.]